MNAFNQPTMYNDPLISTGWKKGKKAFFCPMALKVMKHEDEAITEKHNHFLILNVAKLFCKLHKE